MKTLIFDTSQSKAYFVLSEDGHLLATFEFVHEQQLLKNFYTFLQAFLKEHHLSIHEVDQFAVGVGPGSYTGTRIAVTAGKAFSFALKKSLLSFCSLEMFLPKEPQKFLSIAEAKHGRHFAIKGFWKGGQLEISNLGFLSMEALALELHSTQTVHGEFSTSFLDKLASFSSLEQLMFCSLGFNPQALIKRIHLKNPPPIHEIDSLYFST